MDLATLKDWSAMTGIKLLLISTRPIQCIINNKAVTHEFCNDQALKILKIEGLNSCYNFFNIYRDKLNAGVTWADTGWKNVSHFYVSGSGKGFLQFQNALTECQCYMQAALKAASQRDYANAVFYVGAAAHLVQDMCVPHHARGKLLSGHHDYEAWVEKHFYKFTANTQNIPRQTFSPENWLVQNASFSADLLDMVNEKATLKSYVQATKILLPRAQYSTAGLLDQMYQTFLKQTDLSSAQKNFIVA